MIRSINIIKKYHMDKSYTELSLLRYYYHETDLFETLEIEHAMDEDIDLRFEFKMMKSLLDELPSTTIMSPSSQSIDRILAYSK